VQSDPTRMCELLLGLPKMVVLGALSRWIASFCSKVRCGVNGISSVVSTKRHRLTERLQ
jgi:hypothetical protein